MKPVSLVFLLVLGCFPAFAQILRVPVPFGSIQAAIDAASDGDTVLVDAGVYTENIRFRGKAITVASRFLTGGDTAFIYNTVIDGGQPANPDSASVVSFVAGEDTTSVFCGFTVTGGAGTLTNWGGRAGGGIWISGSGALICHNRIIGNHLGDTLMTQSAGCFGGGIATDFDEAHHLAVILDNFIAGNTVVSSHAGAIGGGIHAANDARMEGNLIADNRCAVRSLTGWAQGGGIQCTSLYSEKREIDFTGNTVSQNQLFGYNAWGAGVVFDSPVVSCRHNTVSWNSSSYSSVHAVHSGGGMVAKKTGAGSTIVGNTFVSNSIHEGMGGGLVADSLFEWLLVEGNYFSGNLARNGGGLFSRYGRLKTVNNIFSGNEATNHGGALYLADTPGPAEHQVVLINNSMSGNSAVHKGGAIHCSGTDPLIMNSILWGDSAETANELFAEGLAPEVLFSLLDVSSVTGPCIFGPGNLSADPLFSEPVQLHLQSGSPCIDAGAASAGCAHGMTFQAPATDMEGISRPHHQGFDMGAHEYVFTGTGDQPGSQAGWITVFPNPFTGETTIGFMLDKPEHVIIRIFNCLGSQVALAADGFFPAGGNTVDWKAGELAAGLYLCSVHAANRSATVRLFLVR